MQGPPFWLARAVDAAHKSVLLKLSQPPEAAAELGQLNNDIHWSTNLSCSAVLRTLRTEILPLGWVLQVKAASPGLALTEFIAAKDFEAGAALLALRAVVTALAELHSRGLVHGNISLASAIYDRDADRAAFIDLASLTPLAPSSRAASPSALPFDFHAFGRLVARVQESMGGTGVLRRIAEKLAANAPAPYHSAWGIRADLDRCVQEWTRTGLIAHFTLGLHDLSNELPFDDQLYGRRDERIRLQAFMQQLAARGRALMTVTGESGIGKSAILRELRACVVERGGCFALGRCDRARRRTPLVPLSEALADVIESALGAAQRATLKDVLLLNVTADGLAALATDLPALADLLDMRVEPLPLPAAEARNRAIHALTALLFAISQLVKPLVLCIDDLQWSDEASVRAFEPLLRHHELSGFALVLSYREGEIDDEHPAHALLHDVLPAGVHRESLQLTGMSSRSLARWLTDLLGSDLDECRPLAELLHKRSGGNPLFARELLRAALGTELVYDATVQRFRWSMAQMRALVWPDNVAEMLGRRVSQLAPLLRRQLQLAACVGRCFSSELLATLDQSSEPAIRGLLTQCVALGLLHDDAAPRSEAEHVFSFAHERIQSAAYASLDPSDARQFHRSIAVYLTTAPNNSEVSPATLVHHLELAGASHGSVVERRQLRDAYYRAILDAKRTGAFDTAAELSRQALLLCDAADSPARALCLERAESLFLAGQHAEATREFEQALAASDDDIDYASACTLWVQVLVHAGQFERAIEIGLRGLARLSIHIPKAPHKLSLGPPLLRAFIKHRTLTADLSARPAAEPPTEVRVALNLLANLWGPAFWLNDALTGLIVLRMLALSERHGSVAAAAIAFASYGVLMAMVLGRIDSGRKLSQKALALAARGDNPLYLFRARFMHAGFFGHLEQPLREDLAEMQRCLRGSLSCGDHTYATASANVTCYLLPLLDLPLDSVLDELDTVRARLSNAQDTRTAATLAIVERYVRILNGSEPMSEPCFSQPILDEDQPDFAHERGVYWLFEMSLLSVLGNHAEVLALAPRLYGNRMHTGYYAVLHGVFCGVAAASLARTAKYGTRRQHRATLLKQLRMVSTHAALNPHNYQDKLSLLRALQRELEGEPAAALSLFEAAIRQADERGFRQLAAIAAEQASLCCRALQRDADAARFELQARLHYAQWGCRLMPTTTAPPRGELAAPLPEAAPALSPAHPTLVKLRATSRQVAQQGAVEDVVHRLLSTLLSETGAQRGTVVLLSGAERVVYRLTEDAAGHAPSHARQSAYHDVEDLPHQAIERVLRDGRSLVVHNARSDGILPHDRHLTRAGVRSLLCVAIETAGERDGVIALEDVHHAGVFDPERVALVELLAQQVAAALSPATPRNRQVNDLTTNIGPHFLFNALNAIAELVHTDASAGERALVDLSSLYRWLLTHASRAAVPLTQELQFVEAYLRLEKLRLEDRLDYSIAVDDNARALLVPSWVIQPLVENAIKHGVGRARNGGSVHVSVERDGGMLRITVRDEVSEPSTRTSAVKGTGFGLDNLRQRMRALFGDLYSFELRREQRGTLALMGIPVACSPA